MNLVRTLAGFVLAASMALAAAPRQPNILLIYCDDLAYQAISA